jgi:hypothetical protein
MNKKEALNKKEIMELKLWRKLKWITYKEQKN